jgi:DNA-binding HxlR family transcriptional regulator
LTANTVNGSGNGARSGAQTLVLLVAPLNALILRALAAGPKQQTELRRETGSPAQTTLRAQLKKLVEIGAIDKQRRNRFPGVLEYELTGSGRGLLVVAHALDRWLGQAPEAPLRLGSGAAKAAIKALAEGWSTTMLRALAAGPLSLTELDRVIGALSYPSLERRLAALRLTGQVEARASNGRGTPYGLTDWAREGVGPLAAAARWERCNLPRDTAPIGRIDAEAIFLLTVPLLSLTDDVSGSCRMAVEIPGGDGRRLAGVVVAVENGRIESCTSRLQGTPNAWALGSAAAWLEAIVDADTDRIEPGGDGRLAHALLDCLHRALFGAERSVRS